MISDKVKELEALRNRAAELEAAVSAEHQRELAGLPREFGFESVDAFVEAVLEATGGRRSRRGRPTQRRAAGSRKGRAPRATITDQTRAEVKKLVESGRTGSEIAQTVGISLPSVQNIKKALGLVKARK